MIRCVLAVLLSSPALAGPTQAEMTPRQKALHELVSIEVKTAKGIHDAVGLALEKKEYQVGAACKTAHSASKDTIQEAKKLREANEWKAAYIAFRTASSGLQPCAEEFADKTAPKALKALIAERMHTSEAAMKNVHAYLAGHGPAEANAHHAKAKELHAEMKAEVEAKHHREAVKLWFQTMHELEKAVHTAKAM